MEVFFQSSEVSTFLGKSLYFGSERKQVAIVELLFNVCPCTDYLFDVSIADHPPLQHS